MNILCCTLLLSIGIPAVACSDQYNAFIAISVDFEQSDEIFKMAYNNFSAFPVKWNRNDLAHYLIPKDRLMLITHHFDYSNKSEAKMLGMLRNITDSVCDFNAFRFNIRPFYYLSGIEGFENGSRSMADALVATDKLGRHINSALEAYDFNRHKFERVPFSRIPSEPIMLEYPEKLVDAHALHKSNVQLGNRISVHLTETTCVEVEEVGDYDFYWGVHGPEIAAREFACS